MTVLNVIIINHYLFLDFDFSLVAIENRYHSHIICLVRSCRIDNKSIFKLTKTKP